MSFKQPTEEEATRRECVAAYLDSVYRIEYTRKEYGDGGGMLAFYGLEMHRLRCHEEMCEAFHIKELDTKDICLNLDKTIGFDVDLISINYDLHMPEFVDKLIALLEKIPVEEEQP